MLEFPRVGEAYSTGLSGTFDYTVVLEGWREVPRFEDVVSLRIAPY